MFSLKLYLIFFLIINYTVAEIRNKGWWKNMVFYQIYPRSFMDSNGDGNGDLRGIISKLDHFIDMGVTALWLSPIYPSPMVDSGYDITNFCDIDPMYGTLKDFDEFIRKTKNFGIKVILDFVPNHTSDKHKWFIKSVNGDEKYRDYYIWREGRENNTKPPNNWISVFGGSAWTYNKKRNLWYYHQFNYRQPDLNYNNPKVRNEIEKVLHFWLNKGVNGFRIDAVPNLFENDDLLDEPLSHIPGYIEGEYKYHFHNYTTDDPRDYKLIADWRNILNKWTRNHNQEEKIIMTEVYSLHFKNILKYYNFGSNVPFNFGFIVNIKNDSKPTDYIMSINIWIKNMPVNTIANWVTDNHDNPRAASIDLKKPTIKLVLALILPGITCMYYGNEIAMKDNFDITWNQTQDPRACRTDPQTYQKYSRDPSRTPFQWDNTMNAGFTNASETWLPVNNNYKDLNLQKQKNESVSHYKFFQILIKLKNTSKVLKYGSLRSQALNYNTVLLILRQYFKERILLIINFSDDVTHKVNLDRYLPDTENATVIVSNVGSKVKWGSYIKLPVVELPPNDMLIISDKIAKL